MVEGVAYLQVVAGGDVPVCLQRGVEVAVAFGDVLRAFRLAEEEACRCGDGETVCRLPCEFVVGVECRVSVYGGDDARHGVGSAADVVVVFPAV